MSASPGTRRRFLATLAAAGAACVTHARVSGAQSPAAARRIDIHQHFVSPAFHAALTARSAKAPVPGLAAWKDYSPARAIEAVIADERVRTPDLGGKATTVDMTKAVSTAMNAAARA